MPDEPDYSAHLRRLQNQEEEESYLPQRRVVKVEEHLVRLPRIPGAPPALYGGLIQVRIFDYDQVLEERLSPLETSQGLFLDEHQATVEQALTRHGASLRERLE